jgi:hypothetical protein
VKLGPLQDPWAARLFERPPGPGFRDELTRAISARAQTSGLTELILGITGDEGYWCEWRLGSPDGDRWLFSMDSNLAQTRWAERDADGPKRLRERIAALTISTPPDARGCVTGSGRNDGLYVTLARGQALVFRGFDELRELFVAACSVDTGTQQTARLRAMRARMGLCEECGETLGFARRVILRSRVCGACG